MPVVARLDVADLAATRFAVSPLAETVKAVQLLGNPGKCAVNSPWVQWARRQLDGKQLRLPRLWPLVVTGTDYSPEFLGPAPARQHPAFGAELSLVRATQAGDVRASLRRVFGPDRALWPASAVAAYERPAESLAEIAAELAEFHDRLIAPHWQRIRPVLDADIAYRTGLLASGGASALFGDMHPDLRWAAGVLSLADGSASVREAVLGPGGIVLVPSVFNWPDVSVKKATSTQTTLLYPARGAATVWYALDPTPEGTAATEALLGVVRTRLLETLRAPSTTTGLARQFGVTPSAISQHLAVLCRGGLAGRRRVGRSVLYQISDLGQSLLAASGTRG
jgi:DNA-binding transcriptional ArsR family regulator